MSKKPDPVESALTRARGLIRHLAGAIKDKFDYSSMAMMFSREEYGGLLLDSADVREYQATYTLLCDAIGDEYVVSRRTIDSALQTAILSAINPRGASPDRDFETRLDDAIATLRKALGEKLRSFVVFFPVEGLEKDGLPAETGPVTWCLFDGPHYERFNLAAKCHRVSEEQVVRQRLIHKFAADNPKQVFARVVVEARDYGASLRQARLKVSRVIDVINFFSDMAPYSHGWLYLPSEGEPRAVTSAVIESEGESFSFIGHRHGPLTKLSLSALREADSKQNLGFKRALQLVADQQATLAKQLTAAICWAGRARAEPRREQAFLLFAIALESAVLPEQSNEELTYRLRIRVAHLLGRTVSERADLSKRVRELYRIRSKIVHTGHLDVSETRLAEIRALAKRCIVRLLQDDEFNVMRNKEQLQVWFEAVVLR